MPSHFVEFKVQEVSEIWTSMDFRHSITVQFQTVRFSKCIPISNNFVYCLKSGHFCLDLWCLMCLKNKHKKFGFQTGLDYRYVWISDKLGFQTSGYQTFTVLSCSFFPFNCVLLLKEKQEKNEGNHFKKLLSGKRY